MKVKTLTKLMTITVISTLIVAKAASANEDPRKQSNLWIGKEQTEAKTIKATNVIVPITTVEKKPAAVKDKPALIPAPTPKTQVNTPKPKAQTNTSAPKTNAVKQSTPKAEATKPKKSTSPFPFAAPGSESASKPKNAKTKKESPKAAAPTKESPKKSANKSDDDDDPFHMKNADKNGGVFKLFGK